MGEEKVLAERETGSLFNVGGNVSWYLIFRSPMRYPLRNGAT